MTQVLIAGAGIGGLTAARALELAGFAVRIFERAPELREVGAGITVQANAMLALRHLGLEEKVRAAGQTIEEASLMTAGGRDLGTTSVAPLTARLGAPSVILHRARLQALLHGALERTEIELGHAAVDLVDDGRRVTLVLEDGATVEGEVLVGGDGLRSAVRAALLKDGSPRYSGYTTWRGVARGVSVARAGSATEIWGGRRRFGLVPMTGDELYWYAAANAPAGGSDPPGRARDQLTARFADFPKSVKSALAATAEEEIVRTDVFDRAPAACWHRGGVVLLGDAAHPMEPNLGQGGGQAIEDAVVLADALRRAADPRVGLDDYSRRRAVRAARFVQLSRRFGAITHRLPGWSTPLRDALFARLPPSLFSRRLGELLAFTL